MSQTASTDQKSLEADEKAQFAAAAGPVESHDEDTPEFAEKKDLRRGLDQRHIQMIALAGTIGTGLFLGSGGAIAQGGPVGAFMGYLFVGVLVSGVVLSVAEMAALVPLSGGVVRHAEYFFDPALSFAQGWNLVYNTCMSLPAEITAAAVLIQFWTPLNAGIWITILGLLVIFANLLFVRVYGEMEFFFSMLKIMLVIGLIIMGLVIDLGGAPNHHRFGFQYWRNPGPFVDYLGISGSWGHFLGFWATFTNAAYAYSGVESIAAAAAETRNPRQNIPRAAKRIFWRVLIFYVVSIFIVTLIVPSNDPELLNGGSSTTASPFVIAATNAGIKVVPHIINAVVLTSAWSAGNSGMLGGSRALYGLAHHGHAPRVFLAVNRFGVPWVAVTSIGLFIALAYMTLSAGAATVFEWFQALVSAASIVQWIIITLVYLRFYYGLKHQGISRDELPWKGPLQPYAAWAACIAFTVILLTGGFPVFKRGNWTTQTFISAYLDIPIILVLYFGYKWIRGTKVIPLDDLPFRHFLQIYHDNPEPKIQPATGWKRLNILWS